MYEPYVIGRGAMTPGGRIHRRGPLMHTKVSSLLALLLALGCASQPKHVSNVSTPIVAAGDSSAASAQASGFDPARLARINSVMRQAVADGTMPGAVTLIARAGQVVHFEVHGFRDREQQLPMTKDTLFRIFSMTKPITSVAVMMLYEEGRFDLEDRVSEYLPELAGVQVADDPEKHAKTIKTHAPTRAITIRDLLRHTSGLTYGFFGDTAVDRAYREAGLLKPAQSSAELLAALGKLPLQYDPGARWHYSMATDVLGRLVEVLSGQSLGQFFEQRILKPLAMNDTSFQVPHDKLGRFAAIYVESDKGTLAPAAASETERYASETTKLESGGGGLVSSASDYLRFCEMLRRGGELDGVRLLAPTTVRMMTQDQLPMSSSPMPGFGFGLGFGINLDPGKLGTPVSKGTFSWGGAAGTSFWIDPVEDIIGVFMVQIRPRSGPPGTGTARYKHAERFRNLAYQALSETRAGGGD
jgi:CubicO group peptidase (beta-lactamase class C family)